MWISAPATFTLTGRAVRRLSPRLPTCSSARAAAGTFSDGKLNTGTKDPCGEHILRTFVRFGAPHDILIDAKPHIGTDKLCGVVKAMRMRILELGGEVRFGARLTSVLHSNGHVTAVRYIDAQGEQELPAESVILAIGHSARDTFESLLAGGITLVQKPFSIGAPHRASAKPHQRFAIRRGGQPSGAGRGQITSWRFICQAAAVCIRSACVRAAQLSRRPANRTASSPTA